MFRAFWFKEWGEIRREGTPWVLGVLFLSLGAIVPLAFRYLPELWLVELFPSLSLFLRSQEEGSGIIFLVLWAVLGGLVMILWGSGSVAYEWRSGQLRLPFLKSPSGFGLVTGKWLADCLLLWATIGGSFFLYSLLSRFLFPYALAWRTLLPVMALLGLFLSFLLALAFFWSSLLRRPGWSIFFSLFSLLPHFFLPFHLQQLSPVQLLFIARSGLPVPLTISSDLLPVLVTLALSFLLMVVAGWFLARIGHPR
jgi:hypothetical protein